MFVEISTTLNRYPIKFDMFSKAELERITFLKRLRYTSKTLSNWLSRCKNILVRHTYVRLKQIGTVQPL